MRCHLTSALAARPTASMMPPPRREPAVQRRTKMPLSMRLLVSIIGMSAILSTTVVASDAGAFGGNINNGSDNNDDNRSSSSSDGSSIITTEVGDTDDISTGDIASTEKTHGQSTPQAGPPLSSNDTDNHVRFLSFMGMGRQQNQQFQECRTPAGAKGHCKYATHCQFPDNQRPNLIRMMGYMCVIERFYIGICCPDAVTAGTAAIAAEKANPFIPYDKVEADAPPIWSSAGISTNNQPAAPPTAVTRPEDRGCGLATRSFPKITGGRPADPGEWPWMAALLRRGPANAFCGGVLITDRHVLTAAHCMRRLRAAEVFVRLGEYNFADYNETRARDFRVTDIRAHLDFDDSTYDNDIAVLRLDRATLFTSYIWPVCMPPVGQSWEGYRAVVTGWGTQFFGGPPSDVLMEVALPVWTQQRCQAAFAQRISAGVLCAGASEGGRDSCQGDSGGPLLVQLPNGRWSVVGIVSWGVRCGEPNFPGIYTKVDAYAGWILENAVF